MSRFVGNLAFRQLHLGMLNRPEMEPFRWIPEFWKEAGVNIDNVAFATHL